MDSFRLHLFFVFPLIFSVVAGCKKIEQQDAQTAPHKEVQVHLDFENLAVLLSERMALTPGERVILVAQPGRFDPLIPYLKAVIEEDGGVYLGTLSVEGEGPPQWQTPFTREALADGGAPLVQYLEQVDLAIMLPGATPGHRPYKLLQDRLWEGKGRTIHFHWAGAYGLRGEELEMDSLKDLFYQDVLLKTNYRDLKAAQEEFEKAMRHQLIRVVTDDGTDISFRIGDRPVTKQDGDASAARAAEAKNLIDREVELPPGAVRVAPLEHTVQGSVAFPDARWNGHPVSGLVMEFENGKVSRLTAKSGQEHVEEELAAAGDAGGSFREFALGMNPLLAIQQRDQPWIPYYGYGSGVVRLSLGDNRELGGQVAGGYVRWNFFTNASVYVGDDLWVDKGTLIR